MSSSWQTKLYFLGHPQQPTTSTTRFSASTTLSLAELTKLALPFQKLLFSATVTHDPSKLAPLQMYNPRLYSCGGKYTLPASLTVSGIITILECDVNSNRY